MHQRHHFTTHLFNTLKSYDYVLLKFTETSVYEVSAASDFDLLIREENQATIVAQLLDFQDIKHFRISRKTSMLQLFIYFKDGQFIQIDLLHRFVRTSLVYLDPAAVFAEAVINNEGIAVTSQQQLLEHLVLFNFLNFSGLSPKYISYFKSKSTAEKTVLLTFFNQKYGTNVESILTFATFHDSLRNALVSKAKTLPDNQGFSTLKQYTNYFMDKISSFRQDKGIVLTFSGVDGAGKTTVMDNTERLLKEKYKAKIIRLRHRPQVLPILSAYKYGKAAAEKRAAETLPRTGGNKSSLSSVLRFAYYYLDYLLGQLVIYFKYTLRGYTILYDRYYFDFIVDFQRSNIHINPAIPKFLYRFVFKPELNFFLYAPPEVILKRKQELSADAITTLTTAYKGLFEDLNGRQKAKYISIENIVLDETMATIEAAYLAAL